MGPYWTVRTCFLSPTLTIISKTFNGTSRNASSPKCPQSKGFSTAQDTREYEFNLSCGKSSAVWVPRFSQPNGKPKPNKLQKKHQQTAEAGSTTWPCEWPPPASTATHPPQGLPLPPQQGAAPQAWHSRASPRPTMLPGSQDLFYFYF